MKELLKDVAYEGTIEQALNHCQNLMQNVLDEWDELGLDSLDGHASIYELIFQTDVIYQEQVNKLKILPEALTEEQGKKFLSELKIPPSDKLYKSAELVRRNAYASRELGLFSVVKNKVEQVKKSTNEIVKAQSVYATNELQEKFYQDLCKVLDEFNELNTIANGQLLQGNCLGRAFAKPLRETPGYYKLGIDSKGLKQLLQTLK